MGEQTTPRSSLHLCAECPGHNGRDIPRDQRVSIPELERAAWARTAGWIRDPRLIDGPPRLISASAAKTAEPPAQYHSHQGLWGAGLVAGLAPTPNQELWHPPCLCSLIPSLLLCPPAQQLPAALSCTGLSAHSIFSRCLFAAGGG